MLKLSATTSPERPELSPPPPAPPPPPPLAPPPMVPGSSTRPTKGPVTTTANFCGGWGTDLPMTVTHTFAEGSALASEKETCSTLFFGSPLLIPLPHRVAFAPAVVVYTTLRSRLLTSGVLASGCAGGSVYTSVTLNCWPSTASVPVVGTVKVFSTPVAPMVPVVPPSTISSRLSGVVVPASGKSTRSSCTRPKPCTLEGVGPSGWLLCRPVSATADWMTIALSSAPLGR
mmetsp:Transcript_11899/g.29443  ORF Transcript_11899/g.29443 Transcript_11899/m.29443 type:complete len:230 (+) Transcript_11899:852-1541(+)